MNIRWSREQYTLEVGGIVFRATSFVRNEIDPLYRRRLHEKGEVIRTPTGLPNGVPYMPRRFPVGSWQVTALEVNPGSEFANIPGFTVVKKPFDETEYGPIKIRTNAHQIVDEWELDPAGGYAKKSGRTVDDYGYLLHWVPKYQTTQGCGRIGTDNPKQIIKLAKIIAPALAGRDIVRLEVTV